MPRSTNFSFFVCSIDHQVAVDVAETRHGPGGKHIQNHLLRRAGFHARRAGDNFRTDFATIATCAALPSGEFAVADDGDGFRAVRARIFDRRDGEGSASAGGDADDDIFFAGLLLGDCFAASSRESSSASTAAPSAFGAARDDELDHRGSMSKVGGHSTASSAAMRPLVPVPT